MKPTADVTIGVATDDSTEGTVGSNELVFTSADWQQPQTVTITGVDDDLDDGDVSYAIVTAVAVSNDPKYNGLDAANVSVTNVDDEIVTAVELGEVDFKRLESLNPSSEDLWFRLETVHDGWLNGAGCRGVNSRRIDGPGFRAGEPRRTGRVVHCTGGEAASRLVTSTRDRRTCSR